MTDEDKPENVVSLKVVPKGDGIEGTGEPEYTADNVFEDLHGQGLQEIAVVGFDADGALNIAGNTTFDRLFYLYHRGAALAMSMDEAADDGEYE